MTAKETKGLGKPTQTLMQRIFGRPLVNKGRPLPDARIDALQARVAAHINGGPERERAALQAWNAEGYENWTGPNVATASVYGPNVYPPVQR